MNDNDQRDLGDEDGAPVVDERARLHPQAFSQDMAAFLLMLTGHAEQGQLTGFSVTFVYTDGRTGSMTKFSGSVPIEIMIGQMRKAEHALLAQMFEQERQLTSLGAGQPN